MTCWGESLPLHGQRRLLGIHGPYGRLGWRAAIKPRHDSLSLSLPPPFSLLLPHPRLTQLQVTMETTSPPPSYFLSLPSSSWSSSCILILIPLPPLIPYIHLVLHYLFINTCLPRYHPASLPSHFSSFSLLPLPTALHVAPSI